MTQKQKKEKRKKEKQIMCICKSKIFYFFTLVAHQFHQNWLDVQNSETVICCWLFFMFFVVFRFFVFLVNFSCFCIHGWRSTYMQKQQTWSQKKKSTCTMFLVIDVIYWIYIINLHIASQYDWIKQNCEINK